MDYAFERHALLGAAKKLADSLGEAFSMTALYADTEFSRSAVRRYFPTKKSLLEALASQDKAVRGAPRESAAKRAKPRKQSIPLSSAPQKSRSSEIDLRREEIAAVDVRLEHGPVTQPAPAQPAHEVASSQAVNAPPRQHFDDDDFVDVFDAPLADSVPQPTPDAAEPSATENPSLGFNSMPAETICAQPNESEAAPADDADWIERRFRIVQRAISSLEARVELLAEQRVASPEAPAATLDTIPAGIPEPPPVIAEWHDDLPPPVHLFSAEAPELLFQQAVQPRDGFSTRKLVSVAAEDVDQPPRETPAFSQRQIYLYASIAGAALVGIALLLLLHGSAKHPQPVQTIVEKPPKVSVSIINATGQPDGAVFPPALLKTMRAAEAGDVRAQTNLAVTLLKGGPIEADPVTAARWIESAAEQGDAEGALLLGSIYADGIKPDPQRAYKWFSVAANQGNPKAMHNLGIALLAGNGVRADPMQAASWFMRAANLGYRDSAFDLAVLFERGDGVSQDPLQAYRWYTVAANQGDAEARDRARFLKENVPNLIPN